MADLQPSDLWHFERHLRFASERLSLSDGVNEHGDRLLTVSVEDGDHLVEVALPWGAVRELAQEVLPEWLYGPTVLDVADRG